MSRKAKENPIIRDALEKLEAYFKDHPDAIITYYGTTMACAKQLGDFILENHELDKIPREVQYLLVLTWNSYAMIFNKDSVLHGIHSPDFQDYFESGGIDDRFAAVVKQLYAICKKENLL